MEKGYDTDRWVGCGCSHVNYTGIAWTVLITILLANALNPECIEKVSVGMQAIGELLEIANGSRCCGNSCRGFYY